MFNKSKYNFKWEDNTCICQFITNYGTFVGTATCHPDDIDIKTERTGEQISSSRAKIKSYQYERDCILKPQIKILKHLKSIIEMKPEETKTYATVALKRQLYNLEQDLIIIKYLIRAEQDYLHKYIEQKESAFQKIRSRGNK